MCLKIVQSLCKCTAHYSTPELPCVAIISHLNAELLTANPTTVLILRSSVCEVSTFSTCHFFIRIIFISR